MPRHVDYPRASLDAALELANAIDALGGSCSEEMAAQRLGRKGSGGGAFNALIGSAVKYGLIEGRKGDLATTSLFREYKLAYSPEQGIDSLRTAFLSVPLFRKVHERFLGKLIPHDILDKLLIREFGVPEPIASRVGDYFIEGARATKLLTESGTLLPAQTTNPGTPPVADPSADIDMRAGDIDSSDFMAAKHYVVRVTGPGISSTLEVRSAEDLIIVEAVLAKVRRAMSERPLTE